MLQFVFIYFLSCPVQSHPVPCYSRLVIRADPLTCEKQHLKMNRWSDFCLALSTFNFPTKYWQLRKTPSKEMCQKNIIFGEVS